MHKKIFAIFIVGLFVLSVAVWAETSNDDDIQKFIKEIDSDTPVSQCVSRVMNNFPDIKRQRAEDYCNKLHRVAQTTAPILREKIQTVSANINTYRKRMIATNAIRTWDMHFQQAKNRFMDAKRFHSDKKNKWIEARDRWNKACRDRDSEECQELMDKAIDNAREFLKNSANMAIDYLDQVKSKVEGSDSISEDRAEEIIDDIDKYINELEDVLSELDDADTKDEIKAAARKIDNIWKRARFRVKAHASYMLGSKVWSISWRSDNLAERLDCYLSEIEDEGHDVSDLQDKVDEFNKKIAESKELWEEADKLYDELRILMRADDRDREDIMDKADEIKVKVAEAHKYLREAQSLLTQLFRDIRSYDVNVASCNGVTSTYECTKDSDCEDDEACVSHRCKVQEEDDYEACVDDCDSEKDDCLDDDDYANEESQEEFCDDELETCVDDCADEANQECEDAFDECSDSCQDDKDECMDEEDYANEESQEEFCKGELGTCMESCEEAKDDCTV